MSDFLQSIGQTTTASNTVSKNESADQTNMGKEDFLKLLVAQLENQDPLNPDDATEFTSQLTEYSSLEQLMNINEGMENLVTSNGNSDRLSSLSTIGKEVSYHGAEFKFSGEPVEIGYQLDGTAQEVTISLQQNGGTVATLKGTGLSEGSHFLTWDGLTTNGELAPVGDYEIVLNAKASEDESVAVAPLIKSEVTGVDLEGGTGGILVTQAGQINFNEILGVYQPGLGTEEANEEGDKGAGETVAALNDNISGIVK